MNTVFTIFLFITVGSRYSNSLRVWGYLS